MIGGFLISLRKQLMNFFLTIDNENKFSTEYKYYDAILQGVGDVIRKNSY